jgi:hypothetical protein
MFGPDHPSAVATMPAINPLVTSYPNGGFFAQADPDTGISPTVATPDWFNGLDASLINLILGAGLTPSKTNVMQILNAINALILVETTRAESAETILTTDYNNIAAGFTLAGTDSGATFTPATATTYPGLLSAIAKQCGSGHWDYINANTTLTLHNTGTLYVDAGPGSLTITLPAAACMSYANAAARFTFIRIDQTIANTVTINCQGADYFNSTSNSLITTNLFPGEALDLTGNPVGTQWYAHRRGASQMYQFSNPAFNGLVQNNFTPRVGCYQYEITVTGGGGGGGSGPLTANASGAGGGGAATGVAITSLYPANVYAITIGAGGQADLLDASIGSRGVASSFGSLITVLGGYGGAGADVYPSNHGGIGCGGVLDSARATAWVYSTSVSSFINYPGGDGNDGGFTLGGSGGIGGGSHVGFGARSFNAAYGGSPGGFGGGGGGVYTATLIGGSGGPGGSGVVFVREKQ